MYQVSAYSITPNLWRWEIPGSPLHLVEEPIADWVLATMLVSSVGVFLFVGIMAWWHRQTTNSTAPGTEGVKQGALQDSNKARA
jgi:hypothetical protein